MKGEDEARGYGDSGKMELSRSLSLLRLSPSSTCTSSASSSSSCPSFRPSSSSPAASFQKLRRRQPWRRSAVKAAAEGGGDTVERISGGDSRFGGAAMEISPAPASGSSSSSSVIERSFSRGEADGAVWEKLEAIVRLSYGIGVYGAMAMAGNVICSVTGVDPAGGFQFSLNAIVEGLGYAAPPIMALLFILDDEVVKHSPYARAIRDVEDEELRSFFYGMSPWQFLLIVSASSVGEGLFYRAAIQGSLADVFLRSTDLMKDAHGIASLTGMLPVFVPFAQAFAAATTAALTGSLYYVATTPKDPTYVVAPVLRNRAGREDMKKLFAAWYERRQLKKIYSPLLEGLLALYLGFEWIQTGNMLAPMITHGIYSAVVLGHGLWKIHYHRRRLRHRTQLVRPLLPPLQD